MSAYEGSKMQEADEARLRPGDKGYRAPPSPGELAFQKPDAKPRSLHEDIQSLILRFRSEYGMGTLKYAKDSLRVVIDDNDGTFRLTVKS